MPSFDLTWCAQTSDERAHAALTKPTATQHTHALSPRTRFSVCHTTGDAIKCLYSAFCTIANTCKINHAGHCKPIDMGRGVCSASPVRAPVLHDQSVMLRTQSKMQSGVSQPEAFEGGGADSDIYRAGTHAAVALQADSKHSVYR